jgi:quercetin dioxygenase-like cupin family protein
MSNSHGASGTLRIALFAVLAVVCAAAVAVPSAEPPAQESALFVRADDPGLEWGPCPDFLPAGCAIAVLQGDPTRRNADIFFRVPAGSDIPRHWHTSAERMILVSGELHLTYDGHETRVARPGTYIYGPARLPHSGHCAPGDPCILFIAFEEPVDAVPGEPTANRAGRADDPRTR